MGRFPSQKACFYVIIKDAETANCCRKPCWNKPKAKSILLTRFSKVALQVIKLLKNNRRLICSPQKIQ